MERSGTPDSPVFCGETAKNAQKKRLKKANADTPGNICIGIDETPVHG
jgi:hypothetical protein